jgi:hypothetical protein
MGTARIELRTGYWTDSSMDLMAGLDVFELPFDVVRDDMPQTGSETGLPERSAYTTD